LDFSLGYGLGIVSMLTLGVQTYIMAKSSRRLGPLRASLWYQAISLGILLLLSVFLLHYNGMTWWAFLTLILTGIVALSGILAFMKGLQVGHVSVVVTVASAWGAVTAVLGVLLLGDSITLPQVGFIALIVLGTILVSLDLEAVSRRIRKAENLGIEYAIVTLFSWGAYFFLMDLLDRSLGWFAVSVFVTALTVLFIAVYGAITKERMRTSRSGLGLLLAMGAFNVIVLFAYNLGVTLSYAAILAPVSAASPLVTIILALVLLREKLAMNQKVGIAMILAGIILLAL
jgi:drug/metabolite transporter (DMT)-like permease